MSLNAREIDRILQELDLVNVSIEKVIQRDFRNLFLQLFRPPRQFVLRICLENPRVRFHSVPETGVARQHPGKRSHQRFEDFLHSRIRGGRIVAVEHLFRDRIVMLTIRRSDEETRLYLRLWGTRANMIVTDQDGTILDAWFRKPQEGIETGGVFLPAPPIKPGPDRPERPVAEGSTMNRTVAEQYHTEEAEKERNALIATCRRALEKRASRLRARLAEITQGSDRSAAAEQLRHHGELILAYLHRAHPGATHLEVEDYSDSNRSLVISLDPQKSAAENAQILFDRARRAEESREFLTVTRGNLEHELTRAEQELPELEARAVAELRELAATLKEQNRRSPAGEVAAVGLEFTSGGFQIVVGRNARENDQLLRRRMRGNDWWLHTRDVPGGYVFIRAPRGKSIPLEVLLDAGNLAVFFSRARGATETDLYYTQVKYLRRPREAPLGTVLPTQEKNLTIRCEPERLQRLGIGSDVI